MEQWVVDQNDFSSDNILDYKKNRSNLAAKKWAATLSVVWSVVTQMDEKIHLKIITRNMHDGNGNIVERWLRIWKKMYSQWKKMDA